MLIDDVYRGLVYIFFIFLIDKVEDVYSLSILTAVFSDT